MKNKLVVTFTAVFTGIFLGNITPQLELLPPAQAGFWDKAGRLIIGVTGRTGGEWNVPLRKTLTIVCRHDSLTPYDYTRVYRVLRNDREQIGLLGKNYNSEVRIRPVRGRNTYTIVGPNGKEIERFVLNGVP